MAYQQASGTPRAAGSLTDARPPPASRVRLTGLGGRAATGALGPGEARAADRTARSISAFRGSGHLMLTLSFSELDPNRSSELWLVVRGLS